MSYPQVTFARTTFHGPSLLKSRKATVSRVTVKAQLKQLRETGRYDCFKLGWHPIYDDKSSWPVPPSLFWDSDVGKWIEGACYLLAEDYDVEIDHAVRELVEMIRSASQDDGYLNVYFTVVEPDARWTNIRDMHELYNAGHLIEGALAHREYYKNDLLIEPIQKYVKLIRSVFGPGDDQKHAYPGHPEIELALLRLYTATGNQDAYELARYFIEERGNPIGQDGALYYDWEERQRGDSPYKRPNAYPMTHSHWYNQAHAPILEQDTVEGHSVRAMYLFTAVTDLLCIEKSGAKSYGRSNQYLGTLETLWNNMVDKKMYLTGGIGAMHQWEGFGQNYFLPQSTDEGGCYSETCASIGAMMWAERLLQLDLDARYADVMELQLYNTVMTAMDLEGTAFTYVNQLGSSDKDKSRRETWFECSCCPPNLMRLYGSLGGYLWSYGRHGEVDNGDEQPGAFINVHLYTTAKVTFDAGGDGVISLAQQSNWPWEGRISFRLEKPTSERVTIRLRIPGWSRGKFTLEPALPSAQVEKGYLILPSRYTSANTEFSIEIHGMEARFISPHPYTNQNTLTISRGPLVYCVEDYDNSWERNHFRDVAISAEDAVREQQREHNGEKYVELRTRYYVRDTASWGGKHIGSEPGARVDSAAPVRLASKEEKELVFIPYYLRANRGGQGHMRVGLIAKP
ncbi:hypothetical protein BX600DRAFT_416061 [Xylariales sp. PMI_506]|nr:hypothetical protein BX600DRAFT_416061 [Xylariales sp. PMI_506]